MRVWLCTPRPLLNHMARHTFLADGRNGDKILDTLPREKHEVVSGAHAQHAGNLVGGFARDYRFVTLDCLNRNQEAMHVFTFRADLSLVLIACGSAVELAARNEDKGRQQQD